MVQCNELSGQTRAVSGYRLFGVFHFSLGFFMMFFASYVAMVIHGPVTNGLPYYVCSLVLSTMLVILSFLAAIIYDRGQNITIKDIRLLTHIYFMMKGHFSISIAGLVICAGSVILTGIYGLSEKCSYSTKLAFNQGMAILLLVIQIGSGIALSISVIYFLRYYKYFDAIVNDEARDKTIGIRKYRGSTYPYIQ